jgi:hypothetical protein
MGALTLFKTNNGNGVPASRRALVDLMDEIARRSAELEKLQAGRRRLQDQLELVDGAKHELEAEIAKDSRALVDSVKHSVSWALSAFGGPRATKIAESLAASRLQIAIGDKAAVELDSEIARLGAELDALRAQKPAHIRSVMIEAAAGYRSDLTEIADDLRQVLAILGALDKLTAAPTGEFSPDRRIVVQLPAIGGLAEQVVVAPHSAIEKAKAVWARFATELDADAMASVSSLEFSHVAGSEDDGRILYTEFTATERRRVDSLASQGKGVS